VQTQSTRHPFFNSRSASKSVLLRRTWVRGPYCHDFRLFLPGRRSDLNIVYLSMYIIIHFCFVPNKPSSLTLNSFPECVGDTAETDMTVNMQTQVIPVTISSVISSSSTVLHVFFSISQKAYETHDLNHQHGTKLFVSHSSRERDSASESSISTGGPQDAALTSSQRLQEKLCNVPLSVPPTK
jgi:hypothetical protein